MDRVLALQAGSRGFDSQWGHMSERFFRSIRPGYPHSVSSELENSGIRVAVGGGVGLIKPTKWCMCARKTLKTQRGRTHGARCVWQWFRTAEVRYENWNTHTHTQIFKVRGLDKREYLVIIRDIFCQFCTLTYVVIPQLNHLDKTVQIKVHNIWFQ